MNAVPKKENLKAVLILALVFAGPWMYWIYSWIHLRAVGEYWPTMSLAMPFVAVGMLGGVLLMALLPGKETDPTSPRAKYWQISWIGVLAFAFLVGTVNYFLMDRSFHRFGTVEVPSASDR